MLIKLISTYRTEPIDNIDYNALPVLIDSQVKFLLLNKLPHLERNLLWAKKQNQISYDGTKYS